MAKKKETAVNGHTDGKAPTREVRTATSFASYYSNDTIMETGPWDVRFRFGHVVENDKANARIIVEQLAEVHVSPQHAKRLHQILTEHLRQYEEMFGPIPMPPKTE